MAASSDSTPNRGPTEKTNDLSAHSHRKIVSRVRPAGNGFTARNAELTEYGAASFVPGEALTYAYTKSITAPFEGLATAYTRSITAPFEGLAAAYAQSIVAPFEGVMSLPDQLGATVSRGLPANVDEMLGNVAKFGHQFDGLGTTPIANLAASMNLGHQFDHLGDLTESWTVSSAHVQNLFPDSPPIESLLSAVAPAVLEPPRAVPLGRSVPIAGHLRTSCRGSCAATSRGVHQHTAAGREVGIPGPAARYQSAAEVQDCEAGRGHRSRRLRRDVANDRHPSLTDSRHPRRWTRRHGYPRGLSGLPVGLEPPTRGLGIRDYASVWC